MLQTNLKLLSSVRSSRFALRASFSRFQFRVFAPVPGLNTDGFISRYSPQSDGTKASPNGSRSRSSPFANPYEFQSAYQTSPFVSRFAVPTTRFHSGLKAYMLVPSLGGGCLELFRSDVLVKFMQEQSSRTHFTKEQAAILHKFAVSYIPRCGPFFRE
ncbi:uncharacterized protein LOC111831744 isoform X2 [Capsella rubella]|uniref:uncharacterized protein LOC111831744 isoform X2 n=1 Tax=Capsella rubella TaxID=81985 RepID=UPI000CD5C57B|nr:uncharacterized protein LOC111831744 isoform X2 [Capsella rubella]